VLLKATKHRHAAGRFAGAMLAAMAILLTGPAMVMAEETEGEAEGEVAIELNKLEPKGSDCRAYFVINNKSDKAYDTLKLDFILFRPDGIIDQRFAVQLAPIKAKKRTVKLFDVANTSCDDVGSFLINDAMECKAGSEEISDCLQGLSVSSRTDNELSK